MVIRYVRSHVPPFEALKLPKMIPVHFDDAAPMRMKAYLPETGEPAIFISDDRDFIVRMDKAQRVAFDVNLKGKGAQTLQFEVGGYEPEKFATPTKK